MFSLFVTFNITVAISRISFQSNLQKVSSTGISLFCLNRGQGIGAIDGFLEKSCQGRTKETFVCLKMIIYVLTTVITTTDKLYKWQTFSVISRQSTGK